MFNIQPSLSNSPIIYVLGISSLYNSENQQTSKLRGKKKILPVWLIELSLIKRVKLMRIIKILVSIYQALMFQALFFICTNLMLTNTER